MHKCRYFNPCRGYAGGNGIRLGTYLSHRLSLHHTGMGAAQLSLGGKCAQTIAPHTVQSGMQILQCRSRCTYQSEEIFRIRRVSHLRWRGASREGSTRSCIGRITARHIPHRRRKIAHISITGIDGRPNGARTHSGNLTPAVADEGPSGQSRRKRNYRCSNHQWFARPHFSLKRHSASAGRRSLATLYSSRNASLEHHRENTVGQNRRPLRDR